MKREHLILIAIIVLGAFLRFYRLDGEYVHLLDSYGRLSETLSIIHFQKFSYGYIHSPGLALALVPFALINESIIANQIGIALYGIGTIFLSFFIVKIFFPEKKYSPLIVAFLVAINPSFVALSKTVMYDIVMLFYIMLAILTTKIVSEKRSYLYSSLHFILLFFLVLQKPTNLIFFPVSFIYIVIKRMNPQKISLNEFVTLLKTKKSYLKDVGIGLVIFLILYSWYLYRFPGIKSAYTSFGGTAFFEGGYYYQNIRATIILLLSPINTPATNIYFAGQVFGMGNELLWRIFLGIPQIFILIFGIFYSRKKLNCIFLLSILMSYSLFFLNYTNWVFRHLAPAVFIQLLFISIGAEAIISSYKSFKIDNKAILSYILVVLFLSVVYSGKILYNMENRWGEKDSLRYNYIVIDPNDAVYTLEKAQEKNVSLIVSTYGMWLDYYIMKDDIKIESLDLIRYSSDYGFKEDRLVESINSKIKNNEKVWYIYGWPEGYEKCGMEFFYDIISENFTMKEIYKGNMSYIDKKGNLQNSFIVYELNLKK